MSAVQVQWDIGVRSEIGPREENQDRMAHRDLPLGTLYIVADGAGGHEGGATASKITIDRLIEHLARLPEDAPVQSSLEAAFTEANVAVFEARSTETGLGDMASTAVLLLIQRGVAYHAHVGDSRAYLYRAGRLDMLTEDHASVWKMYREGLLTYDEMWNHPDAGRLYRAMGRDGSVEVDIGAVEIEDGDAFLLCSDGLCGCVKDPAIEQALGAGGQASVVANRLYDLAIECETQDNVTVLYAMQASAKPKESAVPKRTPPPPQERTQTQEPPPPRRVLIATLTAGVLTLAVALVAALFALAAADSNAEQTASTLTRQLEQAHAARDAAESERDAARALVGELEALLAAGTTITLVVLTHPEAAAGPIEGALDGLPTSTWSIVEEPWSTGLELPVDPDGPLVFHPEYLDLANQAADVVARIAPLADGDPPVTRTYEEEPNAIALRDEIASKHGTSHVLIVLPRTSD